MEKINRYQTDSKIYKLIDSNNNLLLYIGSTINSLSKRLYEHKQLLKNNKHHSKKLSEYLNNKSLDCLKIILIEHIAVENRAELRKKEDYFIMIYKDLIFNERQAFTDPKEYYIKNKERIQMIKVIYEKNNKEKIKIVKKNYYKQNKDKILKRQKNYNLINNEIKKKYFKNYSKINKYKYKCEICDFSHCGITVLKEHCKTTKHKINLCEKYSDFF